MPGTATTAGPCNKAPAVEGGGVVHRRVVNKVNVVVTALATENLQLAALGSLGQPVVEAGDRGGRIFGSECDAAVRHL